jgi:hypothetical protein
MHNPHDDPGLEAPPASGGSATKPLASGKPGKTRKRRRWRLLLGGGVIYLTVGVYQSCLKPLPQDLSLEGGIYQVADADVEFLHDVTGMQAGQRVSRQMIFDRVLRMIQGAEDFVLVDFFLFNEYQGKDPSIHRKLCQEVANSLLEKKRNHPDIRMMVITDPLNEAYGGSVPEQFKSLRAAGIPVVLTDLRKLRDSNPIYSTFWRMFVQWFGTPTAGALPHPLAKDGGGVSMRAWLELLNFKANHRKLIVADAAAPAGGRQMVCMVMSANPHDASSAHGNAALLVRGGIWKDLLRGEQAVLAFSGQNIDVFSWLPAYAANGVSDGSMPQGRTAEVRVLSEEKIRKGLLESIRRVGRGDTIDIGMFYLSERSIVNGLVAAAQRGAAIRVLLDPNRDAFGYQKNGVPNRPMAAELVKRGGGMITIRWANTHGEQFHTKMILLKQDTKAILYAGSANLTRRNIGDFNLETDVVVSGPRELSAIQAAEGYFEQLWTNRALDCSEAYEAQAETSTSKYWLYRFHEWMGTSTF